jgi:hypothetical protein
MEVTPMPSPNTISPATTSPAPMISSLRSLTSGPNSLSSPSLMRTTQRRRSILWTLSSKVILTVIVVDLSNSSATSLILKVSTTPSPMVISSPSRAPTSSNYMNNSNNSISLITHPTKWLSPLLLLSPFRRWSPKCFKSSSLSLIIIITLSNTHYAHFHSMIRPLINL